MNEGARLQRLISVALALIVLQFCTVRHTDPDLWGHVLYGLETLSTGIQRVDPYSYALPPPAAWHNHEWLAEALMAWAYRGLGAPGLLLLQALLGGGAGLIGLWMVRDRCRQPLEALVVTFLFAAALAPGIQVRPQVFTYFFFAVLLGLFHLRRHHGRDWTPAIPPMIALWVNCHGGFLSGLGIFAVFEFAEALEAWLRGRREELTARVVLKRGAVLTAAGLAVLANPYGAEMLPMLGRSVTQIRSTITEWRSLELSAEFALPIALFAVVAFAWLLSRRDRPVYALLLLGVTGFLAVRHVRHIPFFALAAAACLPEHLESALRDRFLTPFDPTAAPPGFRRAMQVALLVGCLVLGGKVLGLHLDRPLGVGSEPGEYPAAAVRAMKAQRIQGNLLVFFDWAQYALWHLSPEVKVFFDGRFRTVYPADIEATYVEFQNGTPDRWRRALVEYPTDWVLVPVDLPVEDRVRQEPGWRLVYRDGVAALYGREASAVVRALGTAAPVVDGSAAAREEITYFP